MRGLPPKTLPLRVVVQGEPSLLELIAHSSEGLILVPVETNLEISARVSQADIVIVDIDALREGGLKEMSQLQYRRPILAIVDQSQVSSAFASGAHGVVLKTQVAREISAAIAALHAGLHVAPLSALKGDRKQAPATEMHTNAEPNAGVFTKRENEVLLLMAEGQSNKQIAAKLGISEHTAKFHVNSILQKMSAQKRVEAVVRAAQRGILSL
jgi:two-component system, NarL family, nitrate/nitrite response regulator NarL